MDSRFVSRLSLRNYRSIDQCDIDFEPLTILVGRNGAGKSNIVDALQFVADALRTTLDEAVRTRGGMEGLATKRPKHGWVDVSIDMDLLLPGGGSAQYGFTLARDSFRKYHVSRERCWIGGPDGKRAAGFDPFEWTPSVPRPNAVDGRLLLVAASGLEEFRPLYDALSRMTVLDLDPGAMRRPQTATSEPFLSSDGTNLASVIAGMTAEPGGLSRITDYLAAIGVPITALTHRQIGRLDTFEVEQQASASGESIRLDAGALSDGTIRALGILVALYAGGTAGDIRPPLVGIEEPETALHPAATGALIDAIMEAAQRTQVIITCHSPDFLDHEAVLPEMIRPVVLADGHTLVGRLAPRKAQLIRDHLTTAGELLRLDQLEPTTAPAAAVTAVGV